MHWASWSLHEGVLLNPKTLCFVLKGMLKPPPTYPSIGSNPTFGNSRLVYDITDQFTVLVLGWPKEP